MTQLDDAARLDAFRRYRRTRDRGLRNELIEEHAGLADALARRMSHRGESHDDLRQVALVGLLKAVERFDPDHGVRFTSFAVPTILGELKRHFRDRGWSVRVPRGIQERILKVEKAMSELPGRLGRDPTVKDIARWLELEEEEVLEALHASQGHHARSLDQPASSSVDGGMTMLDRVGGEAKADAAEHLTAVTGQIFGLDAAAWQRWWHEAGPTFTYPRLSANAPPRTAKTESPGRILLRPPLARRALGVRARHLGEHGGAANGRRQARARQGCARVAGKRPFQHRRV